MVALDRTPINTNFLQPEGYIFSVKKLPTVVYFTQEINVPGLSIGPTEHPNPFVKIPISGEHIDFEDLVITFKIDENMKNYIELFNWINGLGFPEDFSEYKEIAQKPKLTSEGLVSDISLLITTNIKNANIEILFRDAFPISLSGFNLNVKDYSVERLEATARFKYLKYDIKPLSN